MYFELVRDPPISPSVRADLRILGAETYTETVGTITPELPLLDKTYKVEQRGNKAIIHRFSGSIPANKSPQEPLMQWAQIKQYADEKWALYNAHDELVAEGYFHRGLRMNHPLIINGQSQQYKWNIDFIQEGPVEPALMLDPMPHAMYDGSGPTIPSRIPQNPVTVDPTIQGFESTGNLPPPDRVQAPGPIPPRISNTSVQASESPQGRIIIVDTDIVSTQAYNALIYATFEYTVEGLGPLAPLTVLIGTAAGNFAERFQFRSSYSPPIGAIDASVTISAELNGESMVLTTQQLPI